ncbi:MAG: diaminopimelate decarboxylase [Acidimicrobiia bacterium]
MLASAGDRATSPVDLRLLSSGAAVTPEGRLTIGGCDAGELAERFGTPLFVYDEGHIRARCREYGAHFGAGRVAYAGKAFLCRAMARLVAEEGLGLDVATGGELHVALSAGFPPARIVMHGNNKSPEELAAALAAGVGRIVVDSFDEIDRIESLVARHHQGDVPAVLIRVTPGVEAHTHSYVETGTDDSKFGFSVRSGDAAAAARRIAGGDRMRLAGLHCHIGSQIFVLDSYARAAAVVAGLAAAIEDGCGPVEEVNLGGGLGSAYETGDDPPSVADYADALTGAVDAAWAGAGLDRAPRPRLSVEPGRSIVASAAVTLYRVGTIKHIPGVRTYVSVDGGMSDNPRPAMYGSRYEAFVPTRARASRPLLATVAGKHCESGDVVVRDANLPDDLAIGDLLCTPATGAYGYAMASNYNKVLRPAVVFVSGGDARVVVRRETFDDLMALEEGR